MSEKISIEDARNMGWLKTKKNKKGEGQKYNNNTIIIDGITFDSELEGYAYQLFKQKKIPVQLQYKWELQPSHKNWNKETIKRINLFVDFFFTLPDGTEVYFDTKGMATEESKLKYKMLSYQLIQDGRKHMIVWKHTKEQVLAFIYEISKIYGRKK